MTLTEFLLARITEDEAVAKCAQGAYGYRQEWPLKAEIRTRSNHPLVSITERDFVTVDMEVINLGEHVVRWMPAHVLAECEAKRRIVESFQDAEQAVATYDHDNPVPAYWQEWGNRHALASVIEDLAAVYAGHPDYREEWKP